MSRPWINTDEKYHKQHEEKESSQTIDQIHTTETPKTVELSENSKTSQSNDIINMDRNSPLSEKSNECSTLDGESPKLNRALQNMLRRIQVRELEQQSPQSQSTPTGSINPSFHPMSSSGGYSGVSSPGLQTSPLEATRYDSPSINQFNRPNINSTHPEQVPLDFRSLAVQQSGQGGYDTEMSQFVPLQQTAWRNPTRNAEKSSNSDEFTPSRNMTSSPLPPPPRNPPSIPSHQIIRKSQTFPSFRSPSDYSSQNEKYPFGVPPIPPRVQITRCPVPEQDSERSFQIHRDPRMKQISNNLNSPVSSVNSMNSAHLQDAQMRHYFSRRPLLQQEENDNTSRMYYEADPRNDPEYQLKIRAAFPRSSPIATDIIQSPEMNLDSGLFQENEPQIISPSPELSPKEKTQRNTSILAQLPIIQQNEPLKYRVLTILLDGRTHTETDLLRTLKKHGKYLGSVALGMLIYNMIEIFGTDMIERTFPYEEAVYKLSDRFQQLCKQVFPSNITSNLNSTSTTN